MRQPYLHHGPITLYPYHIYTVALSPYYPITLCAYHTNTKALSRYAPTILTPWPYYPINLQYLLNEVGLEAPIMSYELVGVHLWGVGDRTPARAFIVCARAFIVRTNLVENQ